MTRAAIELRILSLYIAGSEAEAYNISEISRATNAAYPHVHTAVKQMLADGLLSEYHRGKRLYCRVDLSNPLTRNLLAQVGLRRKEAELQCVELRTIDREVQRLAVEEPSIIAAICKDNQLTIVVSDKKSTRLIMKQTFLPNVSFITPQKFQRDILTSTKPLKDAIILLGYERLLLFLNPIHQQLLINHATFLKGGKEDKNSIKNNMVEVFQ